MILQQLHRISFPAQAIVIVTSNRKITFSLVDQDIDANRLTLQIRQECHIEFWQSPFYFLIGKEAVISLYGYGLQQIYE